jgi:DNA-binding response OmpR family regulator
MAPDASRAAGNLPFDPSTLFIWRMARILVIDDNLDLARALIKRLERSGHSAVIAADGNAGLDIFRAQPIDLILTDILMPEKEGLETIREIRKENPLVPIIAMSGGGYATGTDYLRLAMKFGANASLQKPFEQHELVALVAELLGNGSADRPSGGSADGSSAH